MPAVVPAQKTAFEPILDAIKSHRSALVRLDNVLAVRPGYDWGGDGSPAIVIATTPGRTVDRGAIEKIIGSNIRVAVVEATPEQQVIATRDRNAVSDFERLLRGTPVTFAGPKPGSYEPPPGVSLDPIDEVMDVQISASPDVGWTVLRDFLQRGVKKSLTIGIYQFTAEHVYKVLRRTILDAPNATLAICRQSKSEPIPPSGTKAEDLDGDVIVDRLDRALRSRFEFVKASTGAGGAFSTSYHIKVAVADEKRFWLSSGNWQSSNQAPFDPIDDPDSLPTGYDGKYNREYHAVIEHTKLARVFEQMLDHDRTLEGVETFASGGDGPELILPEDVEDVVTFAAPRRFAPLTLQDERVKVTPVLTPDNYRDVVLPMIKSAKRSIDLQNQYINFLADNNFPEFVELVDELLERQRAGVKLRIILRTFWDLKYFDTLVSMGFDPKSFKLMKNCHAKLIVVDRKRALIGSHNWSNVGLVSNRDASLLFEHTGIAEYLADIFDYDWQRARTIKPEPQPFVRREGEEHRAGRRASWSELYEEPARSFAAAPSRPAKTKPSNTDNTVVTFGGRSNAGAEGVVDASQSVVFLGLRGDSLDKETPAPLFAPLTVSELSARVKKSNAAHSAEETAMRIARPRESFDTALPNTNDMKTSGWAVLWPASMDPATKDQIRAAMKPLIDHRKGQMSDRYFHDALDVLDGEKAVEFLKRRGVAYGTVRPMRLPYYVLIVGSPEQISFDFQYALDLEYAVGRLWFDDANKQPDLAAFAAYAKSVVEHEKNGAGARSKELGIWATREPGDRATELSSERLIKPLLNGGPDYDSVATAVGITASSKLAKDATRSDLLDWLTKPTGPAVVFTASHGVGFDPADPRQRRQQGALCTQDRGASRLLAETDIVATADASGLVAFFFACFSAGTPRVSCYLDQDGQRTEAAKESFVAALPQALLARGALGVIGHVDSATGFSFAPLGATGAQTQPFELTLQFLFNGDRVGPAMRALNNRAVLLADNLAEVFSPVGTNMEDEEIALRWVERNDARAYVLLGDPAAKPTFK